jgi:hypothetical protein
VESKPVDLDGDLAPGEGEIDDVAAHGIVGLPPGDTCAVEKSGEQSFGL